MDFVRKVLVGAAALAVIAAPVVFGLAAPQQDATSPAQAAWSPGPEFVYDVASIKPSKPGIMGYSRVDSWPNSFTTENIPLKSVITSAYGIHFNQLSGAPPWLDSRYDIYAKMDPSIADALRKMNRNQVRLARQVMLQRLLAGRFALKIHRETKDVPMYALEIAKNGPRLTPTAFPQSPPSGATEKPQPKNGLSDPGTLVTPGSLVMNGTSMAGLAAQLSGPLGRQVVDKTGLTGQYDLTLQWTPDVSTPMPESGAIANPAAATAATPPPNSGPSIFNALREQLGLKLESIKGPVQIIVIDHVEKPSEN